MEGGCGCRVQALYFSFKKLWRVAVMPESKYAINKKEKGLLGKKW